jgi:ATP10 protein
MKNLLAISEQKIKLPNVSGSNLLRQKLELPSDLRGNLNLLFIAFYQWQQMEVNSWLPLAHELEQTQSRFHYYELPTIQRMNVLAQKFINGGMRAGIPDPATRERTITLYVDKQAFMRALNMPDQDHIYILLTDRDGNVLWRSRGEMTLENSQSLWQAIKELSLQAETA